MEEESVYRNNNQIIYIEATSEVTKSVRKAVIVANQEVLYYGRF
jgi:hypothetical protein